MTMMMIRWIVICHVMGIRSRHQFKTSASTATHESQSNISLFVTNRIDNRPSISRHPHITDDHSFFYPTKLTLPNLLNNAPSKYIPVISMGPGREEENGRVAPMPEIAVGDYVIAKNPWGIGPKDEETADGKKLSFMRGQDIAGVLDGSFLDEIRGEGNEE